MKLSILYRGPLASCNYDCAYCPFAKRRETGAQLAEDRAALERFTAWVAGDESDELSILFTPWGEALTRSWYRAALVGLSRLPHVRRVAIQTNLAVVRISSKRPIPASLPCGAPTTRPRPHGSARCSG